MKKEVMEMPAECEHCKSIFDLNDDLIGENWNKTIPQVLAEKYGSEELLCVKCRKINRIIEEGNFKLVYKEDDKDRTAHLEFITKNGERTVWKLKDLNRHQISFDIIDNGFKL